MTDNEKAATFIGWTDQDTCILCEPNHSMPNLPAPDMSKPENYMRALEACGIEEWIIQRQLYSFEWKPDYGLRVFCYLDPEFDYDGLAGGKYEGGPCLTVGDAIVKALAKLYEAEHKEGIE